LSTDPGSQTVVLLGQISQQLGGFTNGTFPNPPTIQQPSRPSTAIIAVNAMWLMSLVLSITSALFATLLQQWARRYIATPQIPNLARERARVRSFLFLGTLEYNTSLAVQTAPTLLHLSVFLFFAGIVVFFFTIHKTVAIAVAVAVGVFVVMYVALTILPYFGDNCPYRTPMSNLCWYAWHAFLAFAPLCLKLVMKGIHGCLIPCNLVQDLDLRSIRDKLTDWSTICEDAYRKHWNRFRDGFQKRIIREALNAPVAVDRDALTRLFTHLTLADECELPEFMACVPREELIRIMTPPFDSDGIVFHDPLLALRRSYEAGAYVHGLDENKRRSCLLVWLAAIHHITEEFLCIQVWETELRHLMEEVRINFADIGLMQPMWAHSNTAVRITSRSICALLAKCLLLDRQNYAAELHWLEAVTGKPRADIYNSLDDDGDAGLDHMNDVILTSFVCGIFPHNEGGGAHQPSDLQTAQAAIAKTLATLMDARRGRDFDRDVFTQGLSHLIHRMEGGDAHAHFVANELRRMFPDFI
jgi:Family of unknown function (DUF6535)